METHVIIIDLTQYEDVPNTIKEGVEGKEIGILGKYPVTKTATTTVSWPNSDKDHAFWPGI